MHSSFRTWHLQILKCSSLLCKLTHLSKALLFAGAGLAFSGLCFNPFLLGFQLPCQLFLHSRHLLFMLSLLLSQSTTAISLCWAVGVYRVYQLCLGSTALFFSTSLRLWKNPSRNAWYSGCLMRIYYVHIQYSWSSGKNANMGKYAYMIVYV